MKFYDSESISSNKGRPVNTFLKCVFNQTCEWIEDENNLFTLKDFEDQMNVFADGEEVFGAKWIKKKLQEKFSDNIFFAVVPGRKNVICFKDMTSYIVSDTWCAERKEDINDEAKRIIKTAAKLVKNNIKESIISNKNGSCTYPTIEDAEKIGWLPELLRYFLSLLINQRLKVESIGQCIMKGSFPRSVIPPILLSLSVEMDYMFASKWFIDQLNKFGFATSHGEVNRFKQGDVVNEDVTNLMQSSLGPDGFLTFAAENVDHNIDTLDGHGTFHGISVIAIMMNKHTFNNHKIDTIIDNIDKIDNYIKCSERVKNKGISITTYDHPLKRGLDLLILKPFDKLIKSLKVPTYLISITCGTQLVCSILH